MSARETVVIWDPLVRAFHWTLVGTVLADYWLTEPGSDIHDILGYVAAAAVVIRIAWGFMDTGHARFAEFGVSRAAIREHLRALAARRVPVDSGHNPFGALMIYLVFFLIAVLTLTGWLHEEIDSLYGNAVLQDAHALAAHALWVCAVVHVVSVFVVQRLGRVELVRPMITGRRRVRD